MIGKTVSHYKILEKLGEGGMGAVYKAQDLKLDRCVALKFLHSSMSTGAKEKQRFIQEAKAASALQHNNICTIHEIDETQDDQIFICMDYYEGKTLQKKIKEKSIPIEEAIDIAIQIGQGLTIAHAKGIVHRDIKPSNIYITSERIAKIIDFGLAKLANKTVVTKEGIILGTVNYMSPEQTSGDDVDHRTDIWSLGVILYEMLSGQLPYKGDYDQAIIYSIMNEEPEPLASLRTGVTMELERIVNKAMAKNSNKRYQHMDEMLVDLQSIRKKLDAGTPKQPLARVQHLLRRRKYLYGIVVFIILMISGTATYFQFIKEQESFQSIAQKHRTEMSSSRQWENSIAVLPFKNISPDPDQEYLCDGMTEQIITNLSKIERLKVIARTSVMSYKNTEKQIPQIGKELNVSYILEGSIRKFGDQIRVTAQLVNSDDGSHLWADDFDRKLYHIFEVQDDVSELIASHLLSKLSIQEQKVIKSYKPENTEAYDLFLKGKYFLRQYERFLKNSDIKKSEQMFKNAIEQDPKYAPAYAFLSDVYGTLVFYKPDQKEKYLMLQKQYIQTAYELDSLSAEVLMRAAFLYGNMGKPDKRFTYLKKSLARDPNHFDANLQMGIFLRNYGLPNHSLKFFNKAMELNPVGRWVYVARAIAYTNIGEFEKAEHDYRSALEISANDYFSLYKYTLFLIILKRYDEAKQLFSKFQNVYPNDKSVKYCESLLMAMQNDSVNALALFDQSGLNLYDKVYLYCLLDNRNETILLLNDLLQKQKNRRSRFMELQHIPLFDKFQSDRQFREILAKHKKLYEENLAKYGDIDI